MVTQTDVTLAQFSHDAYFDAPTLPTGFTALPDAAIAPALVPGATYQGGVFHEGNGAALLGTGVVNGEETLVLAFRGSDDRTDSIQDLTGINAAYGDFTGLVAAVEAYARASGIPQIAVTGHSLGGAMTQIVMATHANDAQLAWTGDSFGSPGAQIGAAPDARLQQFVIADDPAVVLGVHRGEIGDALQHDPVLATAAAHGIAAELPGLTPEDALASLPTLTANYVNNGTLVLLPDVSGGTDPASAVADLSRADPARHESTLLYLQEVAAAADGGPARVVPQGADDPESVFDVALYEGMYPNGTRADAAVQSLLHGFADPFQAALQQASANLQHDLQHLL
ncbi:MAG TPA: hypothetical protein VE684_06570 [Crenalkalicoccus sp.]|nr:hypothetical protein [Crenalkalicoccus sp.]